MPTSSARRRPAVFLDKDGTLVKDVPYNVDVERIQFYPEVPSVLVELADAGYRLIVVSNQPGVAHGYFEEAAMVRIGAALRETFSAYGVTLDGFYYCPHHPDGNVMEYSIPCICRKPAAGLVERAIKEHYIDVERSWMIGDILNDVEAGNRSGCRTILVDRGNETEWLPGEFRRPEQVVDDLIGALTYIRDRSHSNNGAARIGKT